LPWDLCTCNDQRRVSKVPPRPSPRHGVAESLSTGSRAHNADVADRWISGSACCGFPAPGRLVWLAYRELEHAASAAQDRLPAVGEIHLLPRPWDPPSCQTPHLREELWSWLDAVVTWLNVEYVWDVADAVPGCWPLHPHLVHEIAVLADQRRQAGHALTRDLLEEWHRYSLPAFVERMKARLRGHCEDDHEPWPATGRHHRHLAEPSRRRRTDAYQSRHRRPRSARHAA
jgi:hypothetical protein